MLSVYKKKILQDIEKIPEIEYPKLYKLIHIITSGLLSDTNMPEKRGSLKGIWGKIKVDESLFEKAKRSIFPYEN